MQNMQEEDSQLEIACICGNKSFDVNSVVGLCQGCVDQNMSTMQGKMGMFSSLFVLVSWRCYVGVC